MAGRSIRIETLKSNDLTCGRGCVYSLQFHLVWSTKYRKCVLTNGVDDRCKNIFDETAKEYGFTIDSMEVMPEHVHLLISCSPQHYIPTIVKVLKGNSARKLFIQYPHLKKALYGGHLWNPSYCAITASDRTTEKIKAYIETQKESKIDDNHNHIRSSNWEGHRCITAADCRLIP